MSNVLDSMAADEARLGRLLDTYSVVEGRADASAEGEAIAAQLALEMHAYSLAVRQALYPALPAAGELSPEDSDALAQCEWLAARAAAADLSGPQRDSLVAQLREAMATLSAHQRQKLWPRLPADRLAELDANYHHSLQAARDSWKKLRDRSQPPEDESADPVGSPADPA